ncbi:MAG: DUF4118 domain-containing protein, partial [Williamsia herbipolensis]|nr:DUF4118 domain-containing protein [Williamsia herbipolensis]
MDTERIVQARAGWVIAASAALPVLLSWLLSLAVDTGSGRGPANTTCAIALVLPVVAAAATGRRWAGVAAALTAALAFD